MRLKLPLALCLLVIFLVPIPSATADSSSGEVTSIFTINDSTAVDGDIVIASREKGITRTTIPFDLNLFGVIQDNPLLVYRRWDNQGVPISRNGTAQVNVTTFNGPIAAGDYITSSEIPGKGQRAGKSGYVIGRALASMEEGKGEQVNYQDPNNPQLNRTVTSGKIPVAIRIEYAEISSSRFMSRLIEPLTAALFFNVQNPDRFTQILRYMAAFLVMLAAFSIGFLAFARSVPKAVEAVGRNPLARKAIYFSIVLNFFLTMTTVVVGIIAAIIILRI